MSNRFRAVLLSFALGYCAAAVPARAEEPTGFLLRQEVVFGFLDDPPMVSKGETFIFRDGTILVFGEGVSIHTASRRKASPGALNALHRALRRSQVGEQADCRVSGGNFDVFRITTTWYTRGKAGHTFRAGDEFDQPCSTRAIEILEAISDFVTHAATEPGLQEVVTPN